MGSLLRTLALAASLLGGAPAFAQAGIGVAEPGVAVTVTATQKSGRPTLMGYFGQNPLPANVDALVARLNQPNTCSKEAWPNANVYKPCAVIVYYLANQEEAKDTPLLVFRAIRSVAHAANPANTTLQILGLDGKVALYSGGNLEEPLRPMRVPNSCSYEWQLARDRDFKVQKCRRVTARYEPIGILGYIENDEQQILTGRGKETFFSTF